MLLRFLPVLSNPTNPFPRPPSPPPNKQPQNTPYHKPKNTTTTQGGIPGGVGLGAAAGGASAVVEEEGEVDETGVEAKDIELVMSQVCQ
jgi:NACalpha-BTF3-like transcription factor